MTDRSSRVNPSGDNGRSQGTSDYSPFSHATATAVGVALQNATPGNKGNRRNRWDQTPELQSQQQSPQGTGAGINRPRQAAVSFTGDQFAQFMNAVAANNVYQPMAERYHDGKKVNIRGGIDRVLADPGRSESEIFLG